MRGKFIVIEGSDGTGKSTQLKLLVRFLRKKKYKVFVTDEPWKGGLRNLIKEKFIAKNSKINDGIMDTLLFTTDRRFHVLAEIIPQLKKNDFVICNRYYHSTLAYQRVQGADIKWLMEINRFSLKPDLTLIYDVPPSVSLHRIMKDNRKKIDKFERFNFLKRLRLNYLKLPKLLRKERIIIIDANKPVEKVFEDTKKVIKKELKLRI